MKALQPAIFALLLLLTIGVLWVGVEVRRLHSDLEPILGSNLAAGIAAL